MVLATKTSLAAALIAGASLSTGFEIPQMQAPQYSGSFKGYAVPGYTVPAVPVYGTQIYGVPEQLAGYAKNAPACTCGKDEVTVEDVNRVKKAFKARVMLGLDDSQDRQIGTHLGACVRLLFHEAAPFDKDAPEPYKTRTNGCVDDDWIEDHKGLREIIAMLNEVFDDKSVCPPYMSRADMWQIGGMACLELGHELSGKFDTELHDLMSTKGYEWPELELPWLYGRLDQGELTQAEIDEGRTCWKETQHFMPAGSWGHDDLYEFMVKRHGLTWEDTVALLGCHTLGFNSPANSGQIGAWVDKISWFDNQYFRDLVGLPWDKTQIGFIGQFANGKFQWGFAESDAAGNVVRRLMMLNADMAIAYPDTTTNPPPSIERARGPQTVPCMADSGPDCGCTTSNKEKTVLGEKVCERGTNEATKWVETFAYGYSRSEHTGNKMEGLQIYLKSFAKAFYKMTNLGYDPKTELRPVCDSYKPCTHDVNQLIGDIKDHAAAAAGDILDKINSFHSTQYTSTYPSYGGKNLRD